MMMAETAGRYKDVTRATMPGDLPREGHRNHATHIVHAVVADPNPALRGRRQRVAINRMTDALENEYARGRITDAGYWAARTFEEIVARSRRPSSGSGAWSLGDRVDHVTSHELAVLTRIAKAQDTIAVVDDTARAVGMLGGRILELVLIENLTIAQAAERLDRAADRQTVAFWAETFRRSCEALADHWCGPHNRAPRG